MWISHKNVYGNVLKNKKLRQKVNLNLKRFLATVESTNLK